MKPTAKNHLPPDPENMNWDRTEWAHRAILAFENATGTDREDALCDLLTDLMHWADRYGFTFNRELKRARAHYAEETEDATCSECGGSSIDETPHEDFCSRASVNAVIETGIADADAIGEDGELPIACRKCGVEKDDPRAQLACPIFSGQPPSAFHDFGGK